MSVPFVRSAFGVVTISTTCVLLGALRFGGSIRPNDLLGVGIVVVMSVFFFLALPLGVIRVIYKEPFSAYGWGFPRDIKKAFLLGGGVFLVLMPFIVYFSAQSEFQTYYLLSKSAIGVFFVLNTLASAAYYCAEEFLFRGFLFWGLWHRIEKYSYLVTSGIFALFHVTKPSQEVAFAFFASLLLCYVSHKTKSFLPAAAVHFVIALLLNVLVNFVWMPMGPANALIRF